jgi:hypothetical protein
MNLTIVGGNRLVSIRYPINRDISGGRRTGGHKIRVHEPSVFQHTAAIRLVADARQAAPIGRIMHRGSEYGGVAKIYRNGAYAGCSIATLIWAGSVSRVAIWATCADDDVLSTKVLLRPCLYMIFFCQAVRMLSSMSIK